MKAGTSTKSTTATAKRGKTKPKNNATAKKAAPASQSETGPKGLSTQNEGSDPIKASSTSQNEIPGNQECAPASQNEVPAGVIQSIGNLDFNVTRAVSSGQAKLLVTPEVLKAILMVNYKDDKYIMYHNCELHDWRCVEENERLRLQNINDRLFGNSKVSIGNGAMQNAGDHGVNNG